MEGGEIIIILLVGLVVLGPRRIPEVARRLGGWTAQLRSIAREIRAGLETEVSELRQVADEIKAPLTDVNKTARQLRGEFEDITETPDKAGAPDPTKPNQTRVEGPDDMTSTAESEQ